LGNHDDEGIGDRSGLMDIIMSLPYSLSQRGPKDVHGTANYFLPVCSSDGQQKHLSDTTMSMTTKAPYTASG